MQFLNDLVRFAKENPIVTSTAAALILTVAIFPQATGAAIFSAAALVGSLAVYLVAFAIAALIVVIAVNSTNKASINVYESSSNEPNVENRREMTCDTTSSRNTFGPLFTAEVPKRDDHEKTQAMRFGSSL